MKNFIEKIKEFFIKVIVMFKVDRKKKLKIFYLSLFPNNKKQKVIYTFLVYSFL